MSVSHVQDSCSPIAGGFGASVEIGMDVGVAAVGGLVEMLSRVPDPRKPRGVRHRVGSVLAVTVFAALAGAGNFREAGDRAADLPQELLVLAGCRRHLLTGRYVAPSESTIRRVAHDIDADAADEQVCRWLREQAAAAALARGVDVAGGDDHGPEGLVGVAMDGKTLRNTVAPGDPEGSEVKLFSAMLHREAVVIAQLRVPEGTNEITQVAALLKDIDLTGVVVTGDAAHAQHTTAAYLTQDRGGHYALTVKGNQPTLLTQIASVLPPAAPGTAHHAETDRSTGKIVRRQIWVAPANDVDFPGAAQVFRIRRDTFDHAGNHLTKEVVHGITSLTAEQAGADLIARFVRQHWGIENKIHWVRDVVYREDHQHAYTGTGAQVMATLRNLALGLLRLAGITQITRTLEHIAADRTRIIPIIAAATSTNRL
ncbi:ISAs1 family transposase [Saccharopolyspora pogona]|uniref:ISAs1 family transposase n=1 Tax=Saccharopolyspora pogona TaxID=333966 RepID=UPI00168625FA|nr:ISAs1 family transposase [Saccharopolyspora pogona]